jgi:hypothetical protein
MRKLTIALAAFALLSGCTSKHYVADDYPRYLTNNQGESHLPTTSAASKYALTPATNAQHFEFRSAMAGKRNLWIVEFGRLLEATLQSSDVQGAFGHLTRSALEDPGDGLLVFDLHAQVTLKVIRKRGGTEDFSKVYQAAGDAQAGKMFWGGEMAMKNAVQQSTKHAIDDILRRLISDLNAQTKQAAARPSP